MLAAYHSGGTLPATESLRQKITQLTAAPAAKKSRRKKNVNAIAPSDKNWTDAEKRAVAQAKAAGLALYDIVVKIDPHCAMPIAARQLIQNAISAIGQALVVRPDAKSPAASKQVEFVFASAQSNELIAAKCHIPTIAGDVSINQIHEATLPSATVADSTAVVLAAATSASGPHSPIPAAEAPAFIPMATTVAQSRAAEAAVPQAENILRVEAGRIDNVLNLVGELIIGKSMLQQALNEFGKRYPKELLRGKFADAMAFQARVLNDLQRSVMKIRMVPVDQLFRRFPRMVRDVARQCGREVDLSLSGQETDLDKGILDAIAEPLTHLVRNAISHGIEPAAQRRAQGKAARGKIRLHAYHQGNQVVVEVSDDGRGIDANMIRGKAIDLGMTTPEEAARLSEAETLDLIFRPGFSTAEQVTEVSGRGVGMDVVQSVLQRLKATIHVETRMGQGTTFRLKLPLTLAIIKALMFWVEQRLYAIPLNAVSQIARTRESEVHQVDNYEVLQLRNQVLPLLRLGRPTAADADRKSSKLFVLVITVGEKKYGLIVDQLEGEEELVIKALDDQTFVTDLVNGASILGDGKVVLILNLPAVVEHIARTRPQEAGLTTGGLLLNHADRARLALGPAGGQA
jgi:two-component system chemotaxis sensor kinase CheA